MSQRASGNTYALSVVCISLALLLVLCTTALNSSLTYCDSVCDKTRQGKSLVSNWLSGGDEKHFFSVWMGASVWSHLCGCVTSSLKGGQPGKERRGDEPQSQGRRPITKLLSSHGLSSVSVCECGKKDDGIPHGWKQEANMRRQPILTRLWPAPMRASVLTCARGWEEKKKRGLSHHVWRSSSCPTLTVALFHILNNVTSSCWNMETADGWRASLATLMDNRWKASSLPPSQLSLNSLFLSVYWLVSLALFVLHPAAGWHHESAVWLLENMSDYQIRRDSRITTHDDVAQHPFVARTWTVKWQSKRNK